MRALPADAVLPAVLGCTDGILNAVTLAAGRMLDGPALDASLTARLVAAGFVSGAFVVFMARYAELRMQLLRAERHLLLEPRGQLAATRLGQVARREALNSAAIAGGCAASGSLLPLGIGLMWPQARWAAVLTALVALGLLGGVLGRAVHDQPLIWVVALTLSGAALTWLGLALHLV
jgi:predicted membrane protein (TIGR00267 family)